jgi:hypothetical protein
MGVESSFNPNPDPNRSSFSHLGLASSGKLPALNQPPEPPVAPEELEQDMRLESELVLLVSQMDYVRGRLTEPDARRYPGTSMPLVIEMMKSMIAFADRNADADAGGVTLAKAREMLIWIDQLLQHVNESGFKSLWSMFRKPTLSATESHRLFRQMVQDVPNVLEQFFVLFSTSFHSQEIAQQWTQTYSLFLTDLRNTFGTLEG